MKLGPPYFFWGGRKAKNTYMSNDRFFDGFSENNLCIFLGCEPCFVNYGASPSKLT